MLSTILQEEIVQKVKEINKRLTLKNIVIVVRVNFI